MPKASRAELLVQLVEAGPSVFRGFKAPLVGSHYKIVWYFSPRSASELVALPEFNKVGVFGIQL